MMSVVFTPYENPDAFEKFNPVNHVANSSQPMLVIHRGDDYRVSNTQGISTFATLKRRGIPSRMLYLFSYRKSWNTESTQFTYLPSRSI
ncbi:unnamed protein product [Rotaria sp. Silwood1]|nr:unnamed protein product [Rotaria sp. Silwood1]CAF4963459.1 unnamed protein product [Rotaria sp. Silwood1]CAF4988763.1 unnamed protein product [Rotaria sp. Silwood1]